MIRRPPRSTPFPTRRSSDLSSSQVLMATKTQAVSAARSAGANTHLWLGLVLTPGLGPTRGRKLAEHCGGIEKVFQASLTELEAAGLQAHSPQSIAPGQSQELAH